jgi:ribosomal-protein-alanine N-acetyltransferase
VILINFKLRYFLESDFKTYQTLTSDEQIARLAGMKILTNPFEQWMAFKAMMGRQGFLAIVDEADQVVGGIFIFEQAQVNQFELGYLLHPKYWNQGIMSRAVYYAIKNLKQRHPQTFKITASVLTENKASGRVLEKNGFIQQATTVQSRSGYDGELREENIYELTVKGLE